MFTTQDWCCALGDSACPDSYGVYPCVALHPGALLGLARVWWIHRDASDFFHGPLRPLPDQHRRGLFQQALHRSPWFCTIVPPASGAFVHGYLGSSLGSRALHWLVDLVGYDMALGNFRHGDDGDVVCLGFETCKSKQQSPRLGPLCFDNLSVPSRWVLLREDHVSAFRQRLHSSVLVVCRSLPGLDQLLRTCVILCDALNVSALNSFEPFDDTQSCQNRKKNRCFAFYFAPTDFRRSNSQLRCALISQECLLQQKLEIQVQNAAMENPSWMWVSFPNGKPGKPMDFNSCLMFVFCWNPSEHLMGFNPSPSDTWEILGILEENIWCYCFTPPPYNASWKIRE